MTTKEVYEIVDKIYTKMDSIEEVLREKIERKANERDCRTKHSGLRAFNIVNLVAIIGTMVSILALFFKH